MRAEAEPPVCDETSPTWNEETQTCSEVEPPVVCVETPDHDCGPPECEPTEANNYCEDEVSPPSGGPTPPTMTDVVTALLPNTGAVAGAALVATAGMLLLLAGGSVLVLSRRRS